MSDAITKNVHIVGMSEVGVKVALASATATAFWLPSSVYVDWRQTPRVGESSASYHHDRRARRPHAMRVRPLP